MSKRPFLEAFHKENGSESAPETPPSSRVPQTPAERRYSIHDEQQQLQQQHSQYPIAQSDISESTLASRAFIAVQACETCRLKKTRCDEDRPCGLCKTLGVECKYAERKGNRKETSLTAIMSVLKRVESKLDRSTSDLAASVRCDLLSALDSGQLQLSHPIGRNVNTMSQSSSQSPNSSRHEPISTPQPPVRQEDLDQPYSSRMIPISFSQHQVLSWPAINRSIPASILDALPLSRSDYAVDLEMNRPSLPIDVVPFPRSAGPAWLNQMSLPILTALSTAFFETFNVITPILDREEYFGETLSLITRKGFGYDAESCLVLIVLALGCLSVKAYEEGDFVLPNGRLFTGQQTLTDTPNPGQGFRPPEWMDVIQEQHPGLRFLNEARKRAGVLMCDSDMKSCQFYLLSGLYYTQVIRPIDHWSMINRACTCCLTWLTGGVPISCDDWKGDMQSRLFWAALMFESILIQELNLPASGLQHYEDSVPIPKFIPFSYSDKSPAGSPTARNDDTFFHFHFLAQVAHRIILTRIRNTIYFFSETENFPTPSLVAELHHQLEQWRSSLPESIQFDERQPDTSRAAPSPAHLNASTMLHARYRIAQFHIGRPFLSVFPRTYLDGPSSNTVKRSYKALHRPEALTEYDLQACRQGLTAAMDWPQAQGLSREMMSSMPVKFGLCSQYVQPMR
ncbi:MAG: hypothetical protein M1818_004744 [Claussenomyces sp. TS43310]|nr:MAG: hypothetical protein M1818_004744 [Claussenomyces sp. TS43310]